MNDHGPAESKLPPALALGRALARGEQDPIAVTETALHKAEKAPGVFISLCPDRALLEARAAKARLAAGLARSPLDGVPIAWKDLFDVQGSITTAGSRILQRRPPAPLDAPVVARAAGAGLVCVGKTNMTELAYSGLGLNPHFGTPHLPAGAEPPRVPGGSSSGSAIAVATGIVPLAVGSDTAGSLRVPAAFTGIVSYRPSRARHDLSGVTPLARSLDTIGPMATSVADCIALDDCMRTGLPRPRRPTQPSMLRIVVDSASLDDERVAHAVRANLEAALDEVAAAGVQVVHRPVPAVAETLRLIDELGWLGAPEAYTEHAHLLHSKDAELMDPRVRQRLLAAADVPARNVLLLQRARKRLMHAIREELEGALLVMPTVAHPAPELQPLEQDAELFSKVNLQTLRLTMVASYLDLPTVALPSGTDPAGHHTGLQVSAPCGDDERLLRAALALSHLLGLETPGPQHETAELPEGEPHG